VRFSLFLSDLPGLPGPQLKHDQVNSLHKVDKLRLGTSSDIVFVRSSSFYLGTAITVNSA
jgi:hypothetical protein